MEPSFNTVIPLSSPMARPLVAKVASELKPSSKKQASVAPENIFLRKGNAFHRVAVKDIVLLQADRNYTTVYTKTDKYIYSIVLKKMEQKFPVESFLRVHRSYLVNIEAVTGFEGNLLFVGNQRVPVSRSYRMEVFKLFNVI